MADATAQGQGHHDQGGSYPRAHQQGGLLEAEASRHQARAATRLVPRAAPPTA